MKEQLISFETAKLAKEKGLPQDSFYFEDYETEVPFYGLDNELNKGDEDRFGQCKSISQSLLQKWLREKYSIYAESRYNETFNYFEDYVFYNNNYPKPTCIQKDVHSTYEIGLEFALIEALNLIDSDLMKDNVIGIMGIGYVKSCELAKELVNTKIVGNTKKLSEIIEEEKSFKITAPEPIEIDDLVISNVKERGVIPPNFYKKRRN